MLALSRTALIFDVRAQQRALWICVGISMFIHIAVLSSFSGLREGKPTQAPVKALTAKLAPPSVVPAAPLAEVPPPPPPPPAQAKPQPVPVAPVPAKPSPSAPRAEAAANAPSAASPPQPAEAPSAPALQIQAAPPAPELSARPLDAEEAGSRDQYRLALITAAKRYKRYPAQAMQNGWTGRVEIRLVIGANGLIQSAAIKTSTGFSLLDDTALEMIKKAKPLTQIPAALRGKEFIVDVPVIFDLSTG